MNRNEIFIGSHIKMSSPNYYEGVVNSALSMNETTFMFYTGAPSNTFRKKITELKIDEGRSLIKQHNLDENKIVVHAPYIINLSNPVKKETTDFGVDFLIQEIKRVESFGLKLLVLHPGSSVGAPKEEALEVLKENLKKVFAKIKTNVIICLETMAGKGSEIGSTFEELHDVIESCANKENLGVCLDTCHINDAGYDVSDVDGILNKFDQVIGLQYLKVIHLNDSKNEKGSHKDRHENIGKGSIGIETLKKYVHHPKLKDIPKILETPYVDDLPPYKEEIDLLLSN